MPKVNKHKTILGTLVKIVTELKTLLAGKLYKNFSFVRLLLRWVFVGFLVSV